MTKNRNSVKKSKRWVIKIGSAVLTADGKGLNKEALAQWSIQLEFLMAQGLEFVIVSSGAVAEGMARLGRGVVSPTVSESQVAAAIGQMGLMQAYESEFKKFNRNTAQVLLSHNDILNRQRYLNARNTINTLISLGVVVIINENDVVATEQIRFGDNDTLAAMVANLIDADLLVILTDQDGFFDADPRKNTQAKLISCANSDDKKLYRSAGSSGLLGQGGMVTKLKAAKIASRSGADTIIVGGKLNQVFTRLSEGEMLGTLLVSSETTVTSRKQWLGSGLKIRGRLILDAGALNALKKNGKSLLPVGVTSVEGNFHKGDLVKCTDSQGIEIARGLVNYSSKETAKIIGKKSASIVDILGYNESYMLIHRDNLSLN